MDTDIKKIEKRTVRYWLEDGFTEMTMGGLLLLIALLFWAQTRVPRESAWRIFFGVGLMPLILFGIWAVNKIVRSMKQKFTYPRTGYVSYRKTERKTAAVRGFIIGALTAILMSLGGILFARKPAGFVWEQAFTGAGFALVFSLLALRSNMIRIAGLAVLSLGIGMAIAFSGLGKVVGLAVFYAVLAVSSFLSGLIGFRRYLRDNPPAGEDVR